MDIIFDRDELSKGVQTIAAAAAKSNTLPILSHIRIKADEEKGIEFAATDLEVGMRMNVEGEVKSSGVRTLPAKKFADIVRALSGETVELKSGESGEQVNIVSGKAKFRLHSLDGDEFPNLPAPGGKSASISVEGLKDMFRKTAFAVSDDGTRHFISGVYFSAKGANSMAATDGKRLALVYSGMVIENEFDAIIPTRAIEVFSKTFSDGDVTVSEKDNQMIFASDTVVLTTRLIEGEYPDYEAVIKPARDNDIEMTVERDDLMKALRRVSLVANPKAGMRLELKEGELKVSASTIDVGEAQDTVEVEFQGEPFEITLSYWFITDFLGVVETGKLVFKFKDALSPVWVQPEGETCYEYVMMPMRL